MGRRDFKNTDDWNSSKIGGGRVVFNKTTTFKIEMKLDRLDDCKLGTFQTEALEYLDVKPISFTYDFGQKDESKRKFTKTDIKKIVKELQDHLEVFMKDVNNATEIQAKRRFAELQEVDEDLAMKYLPDSVKDIFIF